MTAETELAEIAREVKACTKCKLYQSAKQGVPGEGPATAEIMFIGEGPGFHEDQQGRPFVGPSGKFLEDLLASIGLKRCAHSKTELRLRSTTLRKTAGSYSSPSK